MEDRALVGVDEMAKFLRVNSRTIGRLIRVAGLPAARIGAHKCSTVGLLVRWIEAKAEEARNG
jgi:excisionase family DNA binding protein